MSFRALPDFRLSQHSAIGLDFLRGGVEDFAGAVRYAARLPWVHAADSAGEYRGILRRGAGTSAARHALLAALAAEHGVPVRLLLAIHELNVANTPAATAALRQAGTDRVLDFGCWLWYAGEWTDLSRTAGESARVSVLHEEAITPEQIGSYGLVVYQRFLWDWAMERGWTVGKAWEVRQSCLAAKMAYLATRVAA